MKKLLIMAALAIGTMSFAQENKNEVKETVTTKTNVKDNTGTKVYKKDVTKTQTENVDLKISDANQTNQMASVKPMDVQINETYSNSGSNFMFEKENNGYRLRNMTSTSPNGQNGILRPSSKNGYYILFMDNKSSLGYFDANGSFIVENYDPKTDTIVATKICLVGNWRNQANA